MSAAKQARWRCPDCGHGHLAPRRPRRDDVRRYCLPCSQRTGRLVERVAPALDAKRAAKRKRSEERRAGRARRERERERERLTIAGVHLPSEAATILRRSPTLRELSPGLTAEKIEFKARRSSKRPRTLGYAWPYDRRVSVTDYPGVTAEGARETLLHEIVHLAVGRDPSDHAAWHGRAFQKALRDARAEVYGL